MVRNRFKHDLKARRQIGLFSSLGGSLLAECISVFGFDWVTIDTEHSPNELDGVVRQFQIFASSKSQVIVRPADGDAIWIKRLLDVGVMNLLMPDVRDAA